jgi:membrane protein YqaA with SNARE-associated domain
LGFTLGRDTVWRGALAILAFTESSFFPIPPDVPMIALTLSIPSNGLWYATVCSAFSVLEGMMGYAIGWGLWEVVRGFFLTYVFSEMLFSKVGDYYVDNAVLYIFTAAFTPIPYKVFTVATGVWHDRWVWERSCLPQRSGDLCAFSWSLASSSSSVIP